MDLKVHAKLKAAGWVEASDCPGAFVRSPELREKEKINWGTKRTELLRQVEDAAKLEK